MRLLVIEPLSRGHEHSEFNRDYLRLLGALGAEIEFVATASHLDAVLNGPERLPMISPVPSEFLLDRGLIKIVRNAMLFRCLIRQRADKNRRVVILTCNNSLLVALKVGTIGVGVRLAIVLHGFLADLGRSHDTWAFKIVRFALSWRNGTGRYIYILISEHIRDSIDAVLPPLSRHIRVLPSPSSYRDISGADKPFSITNIRLGAAGVFSLSKGTHKLLDVVLACVDVKHCSFYYIGRMQKAWRDKFAEVSGNCTVIDDPDDQTFGTMFRSLDFVLFFYPPGSYRFVMSGVLLEAIKYAKPILAVRNPMFDYYFQKYGSLGWLFEGEAEMASFIKTMPSRISEQDLEKIAANYHILQLQLAAESLGSKYKDFLHA